MTTVRTRFTTFTSRALYQLLIQTTVSSRSPIAKVHNLLHRIAMSLYSTSAPEISVNHDDDDKGPDDYVRAIFDMAEYNVKDNMSRTIIIVVMTLITIALAVFMWQHGGAEFQNPLFVEVHRRWSDVNLDAINEGDIIPDY